MPCIANRVSPIVIPIIVLVLTTQKKGVHILNLMGNSNKRVLVHRDMEHVDFNESVDIILTPQFYIFLREELGVKFSYQAKQIAPSLFDDYLGENQSYQFHVYRCGEYWCFFAYDIDEIITFLAKRGVSVAQIGKIFFAQELASSLEEPISLGESKAIQSIDGIVTLLPKRLMDSNSECRELNLEELSLQNGIAISSSYESLIPLKETILITALLIGLGVIFLIEGNRIKSSIGDSIAKEESLLAKNPKLGSNMIRKSILGKYEPIERIERSKRETVLQVSKLLSASSQLKNLSIDNQKISATIETKNSATAKQVKTHATAARFKTTNVSSNLIRMEKSL